MQIIPASILGGDRHPEPVERSGELDLARQARTFVAIRRAVEQVVLVLAHRRQFGRKFRIDMDVASRATAAAAADREQFVEAVVADHFHYAEARFAHDFAFFPFPGDDDKLGHAILLGRPCPCRRSPLDSRISAMGLSETRLKESIDALIEVEPAFAAALERAGY